MSKYGMGLATNSASKSLDRAHILRERDMTRSLVLLTAVLMFGVVGDVFADEEQVLHFA